MTDVKITAASFQKAQSDQSKNQEKISAPSLTFFQDAVRRLRKNKVAVVSFFILVLIAVVAFCAPILAPRDPNAQNANYANLPPRIANTDIPGFRGKSKNAAGVETNPYITNNVPHDQTYILGTDYLGRDLFSRILYGTRLSLIIAVVATVVDLLIGLPYGIISGWKGGRVDTFMQRIIEIISSVPNLIVVILLLLVLKPGLSSIILAIAFSSWVTMARLIRAQTLQLKEQEYILASITLGESTWKIAWKHLIPNLSSTIIIQTMFSIPTAIFFEAFLSFIGIGIPAPNASLGTLLSDGQKAFRFLPYQMWYPAAVLCILMIAFNLFADGLRDAFDPKSD
ncbi:Binding--dependent transport system inner membrane component family protein [Bombilactobacillus mellifer]|uniref:Binding--dependent transport system inner membrane component family protein n=1 Tax=Bombilactobacillus mellifer TaxID=1218492 RepID=A0A0F4LPN1_9LACO|nr:ABC transporter permease [Bombilactobacillus mellifer]KJY60787.1 Binding--dependent transport system inner membrane component family protein [Bombilactobacillus mellifer]